MSSQPLSGIPTAKRLSAELLQAIKAIQLPRSFFKGEIIFEQEAAVMGVYVVEAGEVGISLSSSHNQKQLLEVAGLGCMLGIGETMCGANYRVTAKAFSPATASFIPREKLLNLLKEHPLFSMEIIRLLSEELHTLYNKFRNISAHPGRPRRREPSLHLN